MRSGCALQLSRAIRGGAPSPISRRDRAPRLGQVSLVREHGPSHDAPWSPRVAISCFSEAPSSAEVLRKRARLSSACARPRAAHDVACAECIGAPVGTGRDWRGIQGAPTESESMQEIIPTKICGDGVASRTQGY